MVDGGWIEKRMALGLRMRRAGEHAAARREYRAILARADRYGPAWLGSAATARAIGRHDLALREYRRAASLLRGNAGARIGEIESLVALGRESEAKASLDGLLASQGYHPAVLRHAVSAARRGREHQRAIELLDRLAVLEPDDAGHPLAMAREAIALGLHDRAAAAIDRALEIDPTGAGAWALRGELDGLARRDAAALSAWTRATELAPDRPQPWVSLAILTARTIGVAGALALLRSAAERCGNHPDILRALATQLMLNGRDEEAEAVLVRGLAAHPADFDLRLQWIRLIIERGRHAEAAAALAALAPRQPQAIIRKRRVVAKLYEARWMIADAVAEYEAVLAIDPRNLPSHADLGRLRALLLQPEAARRHLKIGFAANAGRLRLQSRPRNASQGLIGEIVNDVWTNPDALAPARAALVVEHADALADAVRAEPGYTGGAIALLLCLRRTGRLATRLIAGPGAIPRRILQFWDSPDPEPDVAELMATWPACNPGWDHRLFDEPAARDYLRAHFDAPVLRAFRACRSPAQKSDLFRLAWLFRAGGVYADADDRATAPLDGVLAGRELVLWHEHLGSVGNNFIAAIPAHPVIGRALEEAVAAILRGDAETIWFSTGPGLLTRVFARWIAEEPARMEALGRGVVVLERAELRQFAVPGCKAAYKGTARNWSRTRLEGASVRPVQSTSPNM